MLQTTIANGNRGKRQKAYEPGQFMPKWGKARDRAAGPMDGYTLLDRVRKIHRQMGGSTTHGDTR